MDNPTGGQPVIIEPERVEGDTTMVKTITPNTLAEELAAYSDTDKIPDLVIENGGTTVFSPQKPDLVQKYTKIKPEDRKIYMPTVTPDIFAEWDEAVRLGQMSDAQRIKAVKNYTRAQNQWLQSNPITPKRKAPSSSGNPPPTSLPK